MSDYTIYNKTTGRIARSGICPSEYINSQPVTVEEEIIPAFSNYAVDYILNDSVLPRPVLDTEPNKISITADGVDLFLLTGLPMPCTVIVDEVEFAIADGEFGFPTTLPGVYTVTVKAFPHLDKTWEVAAV